MNRRSFIASSAFSSVVVGATALTATVAQAQKTAPPAGTGPAPAVASVHADIVAATQKCLSTAYACRELCVATLAKGDTMMAACLRTISDMIPLCDAVGELAASKSKHLKKAVAACLDALADCEAECKKHEKMHAECKACSEACAACIAACKKVA